MPFTATELTASIISAGYILAIITNACIQFQAETKQRDPLHVTTHYLKASQKGAFEVRVCRLREGKSYSNITAELVQVSSVSFP
jgi:hypothetical protein